MKDRERLVRDEAYRIWAEKGYPDGGSEEHWYEAERRVDASAAGFGEKSGAAKSGDAVRDVAKNAGDGAVAAPKAKSPPLKGEAVDVTLAGRPPKPTPKLTPKSMAKSSPSRPKG